MSFDVNSAYSALVLDFFLKLRSSLQEKDIEKLIEISHSTSLVDIKEEIPYRVSNHGGNELVSFSEAFKYRLPVWCILDNVLMETFSEYEKRCEQYDHLSTMFLNAVRYLKIRKHTLDSDRTFSELGLSLDIYDAIYSSEFLLERAGKRDFDRLLAISERLIHELEEFVKHGELIATEEDLTRFRVQQFTSA